MVTFLVFFVSWAVCVLDKLESGSRFTVPWTSVGYLGLRFPARVLFLRFSRWGLVVKNGLGRHHVSWHAVCVPFEDSYVKSLNEQAWLLTQPFAAQEEECRIKKDLRLLEVYYKMHKYTSSKKTAEALELSALHHSHRVTFGLALSFSHWPMMDSTSLHRRIPAGQHCHSLATSCQWPGKRGDRSGWPLCDRNVQSVQNWPDMEG